MLKTCKELLATNRKADKLKQNIYVVIKSTQAEIDETFE